MRGQCRPLHGARPSPAISARSSSTSCGLQGGAGQRKLVRVRMVFVIIAVLFATHASAVAETKDRLSPEARAALVAEPISYAKVSRLDTSERLFESQLRGTIAKR